MPDPPSLICIGNLTIDEAVSPAGAMDLAQVPWEAPAATITRQMTAEPQVLALRSGANHETSAAP